MKTAISIPDPLFAEAERFAHDNGMSRSELFTRAVQSYMAAHRYQGVTAALDTLYVQAQAELDPRIAQAQARAIGKEDW